MSLWLGPCKFLEASNHMIVLKNIRPFEMPSHLLLLYSRVRNKRTPLNERIAPGKFGKKNKRSPIYTLYLLK